MSTALELTLETADLDFVESLDTFEAPRPMSQEALKQLAELKSAMKRSGTDFTRLAYKFGEAAMRRLTCKDFTVWEGYLSALSNLGAAGKAVRSLAVQVAKFAFGGRTSNPKGGFYYSPNISFLLSMRIEGETIWEFPNLPDLGKRLQEASAFLRANKGKMFTLSLTREPVKRGPLDTLMDSALRTEVARTDYVAGNKAHEKKAREIERAFCELAEVSGVDAAKLKAAVNLLATARAKALAAKQKKSA